MSLTVHGYLEQPYLTTPYLASTAEQTYGSQVKLVINATKPVHSQVNAHIGATKAVSSQAKLNIVNATKATHSQVNSQIANATKTVHMQVVDDITGALGDVHSQVSRQIVAALSHTGMQVDDVVFGGKTNHMQVKAVINALRSLHSQALLIPGPTAKHIGMSVLFNTFTHEICSEYLIKPYLATPYLANDICAQGRFQVSLQTHQNYPTHMQVDEDIADVPVAMHSQVRRVINAANANHTQVLRHIVGFLNPVHSQVSRHILVLNHLRSQVKRIVDLQRHYGMQAQLTEALVNHMQTTLVLYNTTNLRFMLDFPSRGLTGTNWTASSTEPGDFDVNNVNNDIVEFAWRSTAGAIVGITLTCDTEIPQGVFNDTVAILGHNFTKSAVVVMQGSNDNFSTVGFEVTLATTLTNMYYIAPTLPNAGFRYWRFVINDNTNPANYLQVGTIVFGPSVIFIGDDIVDQIKFSKKHFKDVITTEGFTNVTNDRALRKTLGLQFKDLDFSRGNYASLSALFDKARTSLKCLWIPTPRYPTRFAVFGKLVQLPDETHNDKGIDIDYIDLNIDIDESL